MTDLNLPPLPLGEFDFRGSPVRDERHLAYAARERIMLARIAELEADAARYRWLRNRLIVRDIADCASYEDCGDQAAVEAAIDAELGVGK